MPNATLSKHRMKVRGRTPDIRSMLEQLGVGSPLIEIAIEMAFFLPRTTDPYSAGMIILVKAVQRGLNKLGFDLDVDGGLGERTVAAITAVSGPRWYDKSWVQIMGDVLSEKPLPRGRAAIPVGADDLGQSPSPGLLSGPVPWLVGGAAAVYWLFFRKKGRR